MSLKATKHTKYWNTIPKKCKQCCLAIYTLENKEVYYQCSLLGKFDKDCNLNIEKRNLPKLEEILGDQNDCS